MVSSVSTVSSGGCCRSSMLWSLCLKQQDLCVHIWNTAVIDCWLSPAPECISRGQSHAAWKQVRHWSKAQGFQGSGGEGEKSIRCFSNDIWIQILSLKGLILRINWHQGLSGRWRSSPSHSVSQMLLCNSWENRQGCGCLRKCGRRSISLPRLIRDRKCLSLVSWLTVIKCAVLAAGKGPRHQVLWDQCKIQHQRRGGELEPHARADFSPTVRSFG